MNTIHKVKQIQLLGSTFVSGYFAFAEFVNYRQFNQRKIIKNYEYGGLIQYNENKQFYLNVVKKDDTLTDIGISRILSSTEYKDNLIVATSNIVIPVPYDYTDPIKPLDDKTFIYKSTNKSYSYYCLTFAGGSLYNVGAKNYIGYPFGSDNPTSLKVAYIDMVINTTEPITLNYIGEAEFIQNSNIDNNFTPLFKINRYDYNCI